MEQIWPSIDGLGWLLLTLGPLLFFQRHLHRELQMVLLLLTRRPTMALGMFSLLFFPGVLLHEFSHFIMAQILMVRTGRFSLLPQLLPDGRLRLGYVETAETDWLRDALIGTAPLLAGGVVMAYLGFDRLGLVPLAAFLGLGDWEAFWRGFRLLPQQQDFWLWFYLAFAISTTMLPSASDRRTWLPLALIGVVLAGLALLAGAGPWMLTHLAPPLNQLLRLLATIFGVSLVVHLALLIPLRLMRSLISNLTGLRIVESK